jgi:hypothetical protein
MGNFFKLLAFIALGGAIFSFAYSFGQQNKVKKETLVPTQIPTVLPTQNVKENMYSDSYFDFTITYPVGWNIETKMSKNRPCDMAKKFLKNPSCSGDMTSETLYVNSSEKDNNNKPYGITIEAATEGLGFACADNIERNYSVTVKGKQYKFYACQDVKSKEEWGIGEMQVAGQKSEWNTILVNFSAKDSGMTQEILNVLSSIN